MEGHRGSLSILGHLMSVVEVAGEGRLLVFVHQIWVGAICSDSHRQQTVHNDVCVPEGESQGARHQLQREHGAERAEALGRCSSQPPYLLIGEVKCV